MDSAAADVGGAETLGVKITAGGLDIVHHQVERRCSPSRHGLFCLPHDDMRAATKLENRKFR